MEASTPATGEEVPVSIGELRSCIQCLISDLIDEYFSRFENPPDSPPPRAHCQGSELESRPLRPSSSMVSLGRRRDNDDWSVSSTRRMFRFSQEGFDMARSAPIVHKPSLKIGIEGQREFKLSNSEHFPAYNLRSDSKYCSISCHIIKIVEKCPQRDPEAAIDLAP